jgi:hypothetical protein
MSIKLKRKIKIIFTQDEEKPIDFIYKRTISLTIIAFLLFFAAQLVLNSTLTPKGVKLEALNNEKDVLIESNREIAQETARIRSISIIKEITEETNLAPMASSQIIYISDESVLAEL